ncbi:hypothetical protein F6X86_08555 [Enterococcus durans]|uniref:Uncharacterized protein n=1 Tax=Enterococcus durans TaxID=53345 RepID=A0A5N0YXE8_9ENTE|nr:hypothetical protein [Enterococcus durans]KAA9178541.1 hypothetical protein F6X86_08555 [Enterococcus durans]KAA9186999.1 hypothetical protein F6X85_05090 [Enterococcus durans]KAA9187048.1 hypothetical protein F6X90_04455 [Enterococcus durans]KAA9192982.1 hypothetical protein F6Y12_04090 [Enterococcus durans]KAA9195059.1 hypothetical protein F6X88_02965 [Enterococcus durans]
MKKKQKQKLLNQFRPSLDGIRSQLFHSLEEESLRRYGLPLQVMLDPKNRQILTIGLAGQSNEDTRINVPIDDNFTTVLKRIRSGEKDIFDRFRDNLLIEIVSYWNDQRLKNDEPTAQTVSTPVNDTTVEETNTVKMEEPVKEAEDKPKAESTEKERSTNTTALTFADFSSEVAEYPKFYTEKTEQSVVIYEKAADEPRKLAEISMTSENEFTIEKALERKYKVKLTLIPLIEQFAATAINDR